MRRMMGCTLGVAALLAGPAAAQGGMSMPSRAACPNGTATLPAGLAAFATARAVASGATVPVGTAATIGLVAAPRYALTPETAPAAGTFGGTVVVPVAAAGRYRVALGAGAWIDLVKAGARLRSAAHAHGPDCSPVRKMVDFDLAPGDYVVQLSGAKDRTVTLLVARLP